MSQRIEVPIQPACRSSVEAVCRVCEAQGRALVDHEYSEDGETVVLFFVETRAARSAPPKRARGRAVKGKKKSSGK